MTVITCIYCDNHITDDDDDYRDDDGRQICRKCYVYLHSKDRLIDLYGREE